MKNATTKPKRTRNRLGSRELVRPFAMGELWAGSEGMKCEHPGCSRHTCMVYLTALENASLPEPSGPHACLTIFNNRLGKVLCDQHRPNNRDEPTLGRAEDNKPKN